MRCQKCGAYIRDDSVFCNYCGEKVIVRVSKKESDEQPDRAVRPRDEDFDVAPTTPKNAETEKTVPQKQSLWVILLILLAGVLFAVISVLLYQNMKKNQRTVINGQTTTESTSSETEKPAESTEPQSESPEESTEETEKTSDEETETTGESTEKDSTESESQEESGSEDESQEESSSEDTESTESGESTESEGSDVEYGGMIYHISNGTATLSKCYSSDPVVELPDQVNGVPITAIGEAAFANCDHLRAIDIPEGVVTLAPYAFTYCRNLRMVVIPDSVTELGDHCFDNSGPLTFIVHEGSWGWLAAVNNNMNFLIGDSLNAGE